MPSLSGESSNVLLIIRTSSGVPDSVLDNQGGNFAPSRQLGTRTVQGWHRLFAMAIFRNEVSNLSGLMAPDKTIF